MYTCVRWETKVTGFSQLSAGVRQGGVLSPILFAIYVDGVLQRLSKSKLGCHIKKTCLNAFMYADDLLLLSTSVTDLQNIISICLEEFDKLDLAVNVSKSACLRIGPRNNVKCASISSGDVAIAWCENIRYLGIFILSGKKFCCNFDKCRANFYRSFNSIYSKIGSTSSPSVILSLLSSYCLPVLIYGIECIFINAREMQRLDLAYSRAFMKIFSSFDKMVIMQCQYYSGYLPLKQLCDLRRLNFLSNIVINILCLHVFVWLLRQNVIALSNCIRVICGIT